MPTPQRDITTRRAINEAIPDFVRWLNRTTSAEWSMDGWSMVQDNLFMLKGRGARPPAYMLGVLLSFRGKAVDTTWALTLMGSKTVLTSAKKSFPSLEAFLGALGNPSKLPVNTFLARIQTEEEAKHRTILVDTSEEYVERLEKAIAYAKGLKDDPTNIHSLHAAVLSLDHDIEVFKKKNFLNS